MKLQEILTTKPKLQNILEGIPHMDEKYEHIHETTGGRGRVGIKHTEAGFKQMRITKVPNTPKQQNEDMNIYI